MKPKIKTASREQSQSAGGRKIQNNNKISKQQFPLFKRENLNANQKQFANIISNKSSRSSPLSSSSSSLSSSSPSSCLSSSNQQSVSGQRVKEEKSNDLLQNANNKTQKLFVCSGCNKPIVRDRFLLKACEKYWHENCLKCDHCNGRLGELGSTLYCKSDMKLCRHDYLNLYGKTGVCSVCEKLISPTELAMKAKQNVYHLECFACQLCNQRFCVGDRFYLCENKVVCQYDYEEHILPIQRSLYNQQQLTPAYYQQQQQQQQLNNVINDQLIESCAQTTSSSVVVNKHDLTEASSSNITTENIEETLSINGKTDKNNTCLLEELIEKIRDDEETILIFKEMPSEEKRTDFDGTDFSKDNEEEFDNDRKKEEMSPKATILGNNKRDSWTKNDSKDGDEEKVAKITQQL